jgi:hypothetical protein
MRRRIKRLTIEATAIQSSHPTARTTNMRVCIRHAICIAASIVKTRPIASSVVPLLRSGASCGVGSAIAAELLILSPSSEMMETDYPSMWVTVPQPRERIDTLQADPLELSSERQIPEWSSSARWQGRERQENKEDQSPIRVRESPMRLVQ